MGVTAFRNDASMIVGQPAEMLAFKLIGDFKCKCERTGFISLMVVGTQNGVAIVGAKCPSCGRLWSIKRWVQDPKTGFPLFDLDIHVDPQQVTPAELASMPTSDTVT